MKMSCVFTTAACLLWAANTATAQYGPSGPGVTALPQVYGPPVPQYQTARTPNYPVQSTASPRVASLPYAQPSTYPQLPQSGGYAASAPQAFPATYAQPTLASPISSSPAQPIQPVFNEPSAANPWNGEPVATPAPSGSGPTTADQSIYGSPGCQGNNAYTSALTGNDCAGGACGGLMGGASRPAWFGSIGGLIMTRDAANKFWTSFETNNNPNQILNTENASANWQGGFQLSVGRCFGGSCGCPGTAAWEVTYWQLASMNSSARVDAPGGGVSTPIDVTNGAPTIGGFAANLFFDNADQHRIERTDRIYNLEINLLQRAMVVNPSQRFQMNFLGGFRWFQFDESLLFASVAGQTLAPGGAGGPNPVAGQEADLRVRDLNNLFGFQVGSRLDYFVLPRMSLYALPKFGVFGNHINQHSTLYSSTGGLGFDLTSTKNSISVLGQIDLGTQWQLSQHWSIFGAYRVMGVSGVALADNQFRPFLVDTPGWADISRNGNVILHGAVFGLQAVY
jgi:hypothetical protein